MLKFHLFLFLFLSVISSCTNEKKSEPVIDYAGFSEKEVVLAGVIRESDEPDTLGSVFIKIPTKLDTFYQWHRTSDCSNCGAFQYRFADKSYVQFAEIGWIWDFIPDSVYQLTISHEPFRSVPDSISLKQLTLRDSLLAERLPYQLAGSPKVIFLKKEFKEINGCGFVIASFITPFGYLTNDTTLYVVATTQLKKRTLNFVAECGTKDTAGFIDNMYKSLLSVRIKEK